MVQVSVRMDAEKVEQLDADADERGLTRAEFIRQLIEGRSDPIELQTELDDCRSELADSRARVRELRSELAASNRRIDDVNELVTVVEREQSLAERRAKAGAATRFRWWLTGMPGDE